MLAIYMSPFLFGVLFIFRVLDFKLGKWKKIELVIFPTKN